MDNKWKNYGLWVSLFSIAGILVRIKYPNYLGEWTDLSTLILTALVSAGVISNPNNGNGYTDK